MNKITFIPSQKSDFSSTLKSRVNQYFKDNKINRYGNGKMTFKIIVLLSIGLLPFVFITLGFAHSLAHLFGYYLTSALGMAGIGMSIMHDANHNSLSKNKKLNKWLGYSLNLIGGNAEVWKLQHNVLHHTFTNTIELDEDINPPSFLRFSPEAKYKRIHRFQHFYALFFYGLSTISWAINTDFIRLKRYFQLDLIKSKEDYKTLLFKLIGWKTIYFSYTLILPILITPFLWWQVVLAFVAMHFVIGIILTVVFQLAHVVSDTEFPTPNEKGNIDNNWAIHQLQTTCNFSQNSTFLSWYIGGLNYQIEHHLFPDVCHIHYKAISKIIKNTAQEYALPYHVNKTFVSAVKNHFSFLKQLGTK